MNQDDLAESQTLQLDVCSYIQWSIVFVLFQVLPLLKIIFNQLDSSHQNYIHESKIELSNFIIRLMNIFINIHIDINIHVYLITNALTPAACVMLKVLCYGRNLSFYLCSLLAALLSTKITHVLGSWACW